MEELGASENMITTCVHRRGCKTGGRTSQSREGNLRLLHIQQETSMSWLYEVSFGIMHTPFTYGLEYEDI